MMPLSRSDRAQDEPMGLSEKLGLDHPDYPEPADDPDLRHRRQPRQRQGPFSTLGLNSPDAPDPEDTPERQRRLRRQWRLIWAVIAVFLTGMAVVGLLVLPAQWVGSVLPGNSIVESGAVALKPGQALTTSDRVSVEGIADFEPQGRILFTTVAIDSAVTVGDWIVSSFKESVELRSRESVFGDRSSTEQRQRNQQLMKNSIDTAVAVALEYLGINAVDATGVVYGATLEDGPADGLLNVGEVIVALDDTPVTTLASLLELLEDRSPDTTTVVTLENGDTGERRDVSIVLGSHPDADNGGGFIGISSVWERIQSNPLPFDVGISPGVVGGPSAGLAFTLTVLDLLTPGELTGGRRVAVTGSIGLDGTVGDVGGVKQKAHAARSAGAELFIVPAQQVEQARVASGDMVVEGVASLGEALEVLDDHGGEVENLALPDLPDYPSDVASDSTGT